MSQQVIETLSLLQADYQVFYQKLRGYHWNVTGSDFFELHEKFEEIYNEVQERVDKIAERIVQLGAQPPSTLATVLEIARLKEDSSVPPAKKMVENLAADLKTLNEHLRAGSKQADEAGDIATCNLLEDLGDEQEITIWMFRAYLG